jgi:hypothetical protein
LGLSLVGAEDRDQQEKGADTVPLQQPRFDEGDRPRFLGAHGLGVDIEERPDLFGGLAMDKDQFEDLAATARKVLHFSIDLLQQLYPEDLALERRFVLFLLGLEVGDISVCLPVLAGRDGMVNARVAHRAVEKAFAVIQRRKIPAPVPRLDKGFGDDIFGGFELARDPFGKQAQRLEEVLKDLLFGVAFALLKRGPYSCALVVCPDHSNGYEARTNYCYV